MLLSITHTPSWASYAGPGTQSQPWVWSGWKGTGWKNASYLPYLERHLTSGLFVLGKSSKVINFLMGCDRLSAPRVKYH